MNALERRATAGLASIFGLRMFGLFLVLPIFSIYGAELAGATPLLIGLAIGVYGLTQAVLQIPMGLASDRFGRKPVILAGLLVFVLGSVIAALADHIVGVIIGRALQGGGAIAAAVLALAADLSRPERRTRVMAVIGMSVGGAFLLALVAAPLIAGHFGLSAVFWVTAVLALAAIGMLYLVVPDADHRSRQRETLPVLGQVREVLDNRDLLRLNAGIFTLHLALTAVFLAVPLVLRDSLGLAVEQHWMVYIAVVLLSIAGLVPAILVGERYGMQRLVFRCAVAGLLLAFVGFFATSDAGWLFLLPFWLYFVAFNLLEATLPSLVSRYAPARFKGTALGVYASCQFAGAFVGGVLGGLMLGLAGPEGVFLLCGVCVLVWLIGASRLGRIPDHAASDQVAEGQAGG
ncbi:MFS transporter [Methylonatrum kenyense]|uniref:MFS transporter n=1 Tax=Methylonatrum kenyense TaxID=455253 RepID=UPI0020BDCE05|nr:MFS transporter [Methylonatrum kenyense]MCK8517278.1 MFS transporter [Methylonatrum kenyense]